MVPIHELLARIRWDPAFGAGRVEIGYLDKVAGSLRRVALHSLHADPDNPSLLDFVDEDGVDHSIPLHRIREVRRDGALIWRRPPGPPGR
jgi:uncharacterized protein (UPF0248 family)